MLSDVDKRLKVICSLVMLVAIALMPLAGVGDLEAQESQTLQLAPTNPDFVKFFEEPPDPFYGYIPPPMDLSHLDKMPVEAARAAATLPSTFDWRDTGKVTSVKDQNPCGTCWVHGTLAALESKVLIEESTTYNFSEQNLACCTDPAWVYLIGNRCNGGGWSWLAGDTLTKKGSRLEACQPYNTETIDTEACDDSCQSIKMVTDFRMIANEATSLDAIEPIKNAIYNHGPLAMSYAADDGTHMHEGSIYYWPDCPANEVNHLVCVVGWNDTVAHPAGGGSGAWIVKNSWGTGWGDNGYFYLCYGSAGMCEVASLDYKDYDPDETIYYWDEAGQVDAVGCAATSAWMANIFTVTQDGSLTHVDFWTTSNNAEYDIYVYLDGDIGDGLTNLATSQSGTCQEFGYYSIPLTSSVSLTNGQPFAIAVKMTTPGFNFPIPVEATIPPGIGIIVDPPIQTGKTFARCSDTGEWEDLGGYGWNACLRARVTSAEAPNNPPNTPSNPSPANHAAGVSINADLSWTGGDPDAGDTVTYDVYFGTSLTPPLVSNDQSGTTYDPGTLAYNTKYYWKIIATDNHGASTTGPLWDFTTGPASNNPPQLSNPSVQPPSGTPATGFYYYVNYFDSDGDSPSTKQVYIDGMPYTMSLQSGSASNGVYRYGPKNLSVGWGHNYYFYFEDGKGGTARLPTSGSYSGPTVSLGNNPPSLPSSPSPANHATGVDINTDLSWTGGDPDAGDTVTYDVYFGTSSTPPLVSNDQSGTTYDLGTLAYNTKYYWKIIAADNHGASTTGSRWDFTTQVPVDITWNCPLGGQVLIAPNPGKGRPYLSVPAACTDITVSAGAELWGIYYLVETGPSAGTWLWYIPGFVTSTLTQLEPGQYYWVVVSAPCTLAIPQ